MQRRRRQPHGCDIDIDAAVADHILVTAGQSPSDEVYVDTVRRRRELSVLILLDCSSSGQEPSVSGGTVHQRQTAACAALLDTLSMLGDRVASYAFHSFGRSRVVFTAIKGFSEPFGGRVTARLGAIEPAGYTRLGAAIRHATALLEGDGAGMRRLLVLISDGFPYDEEYEGRYAQADVRHALNEARGAGVGCVCLSVGATADSADLARTYGQNAYAVGDDIDDLAPVIQRIFCAGIAGADHTTTKKRGAD
jgi:nitric oxide reductase activation protein